MNYDRINVSSYDQDREVPATAMQAVITAIYKEFPIDKYQKVFEPGIGTGRWAIPLARKGYSVSGIDVSQKMLDKLSDKAGKQLIIDYQKCDLYDFSARNRFDLCVVSHLFHLLTDIPLALDKIVDALKQEQSAIIHIKSGKGNSIPQLSKLYIQMLSESRIKIPSFQEKVSQAFECLKRNGYKEKHIIAKEFEWASRIRLIDGIELLNNRSYSFSNLAGEELHKRTIEKIIEIYLNKYGSLEKVIEVPNKIEISYFYK